MQALDILEERGTSDYIGEEVTQLQHACQAGYFAYNAMIEKRRNGESISDREILDLLIAGVTHDLGHILRMSDFPTEISLENMIDPETSCNLGVRSHEYIGAEFLRLLHFPYPIADLVAAHVSAKRFRVSKDENYANQLSDASKRTLKLQGGPMSPEECRKFEEHPLCGKRLLLRQCDELSKVTDIKYGPVDILALLKDNKSLQCVPDLDSYRHVLEKIYFP